MKLLDWNRFSRPAAAAALLLALGACATVPEAEAPGYDESMAIARAHLQAGELRDAVQALERAASTQPASKEPWLKIARLRVGQGRHVDALAAAEQVLRRDPADRPAYEITISSGLQVALQTMKRLRVAGQEPSEYRSDQAREIAVLMAEVFGPELLIPDEVRMRWAQDAVEAYKAGRAERLPDARKDEPKGDPLDLLGGE